MNLDILDHYIENDEELAPHKNYLDALKKPCVDILLSEDLPQDFASRFAGMPVVPPDFQWPEHEMGEYRFLGQINFSEIQNPPAGLPQEGLLSLFYAFDEDGEIFWGDPDYILGYYWSDIKELSLCSGPKEVAETKKMVFQPGVEIPRHAYLRTDWPFDTEALYGISELESVCDNYMLGYPSFCSLAYDPTPGKDWISLLTLASCDELDWCWHDGDKLMVFIEKSKLINKDFRNLQCDAG